MLAIVAADEPGHRLECFERTIENKRRLEFHLGLVEVPAIFGLLLGERTLDHEVARRSRVSFVESVRPEHRLPIP